MVWALVLVILLFSPTLALAEEVTISESQPIVQDNSSLLEGINSGIQDLNTKMDEYAKERESERQTREIEMTSDPQQQQVDLLTKIDETLTQISGRDESMQLQESGPVRASSVAFVAYANAPANGTYAQYAVGILPKIGWDDHYVFLQDANSSYVMAYGNLSRVDDNTISGSDVHWVRWYYSGTQYGYQTESGQGQVSVTLNNHVVLSSLSDFPTLGDGTEQLRREVMFYAFVAVTIFCLASVWNFTIRLRGAVSV